MKQKLTAKWAWLCEELLTTVRRPLRVLNVFRPSAWRRKCEFRKTAKLGVRQWQSAGTALEAKRFDHYQDYVRLQKSKLSFIDVQKHEEKFRAVLRGRIARQSYLQGRSVLCLAARLGAEVRAFRDLGYFAVGIDLNPGPQNDAVCYGDFHNLAYASGSVDIVYTNSFDHALELKSVLSEIQRVLSEDGFLIVEADPGVDNPGGDEMDIWATTRWSTIDALLTRIEDGGFNHCHREGFDYPRYGELLVFQMKRGYDAKQSSDQ